MLVVTDAGDVGPRGCAMALEALFDRGVRLSRDLGRDHLEVHLVVTGWGLMALRTVARLGARVAKLGQRPLLARVALSAVETEQAEVLVLLGVTRRARE